MMSLANVAAVLGVPLTEPSDNTVHVSGVCTDSRALFDDALFVALRGARYDGHAFVDDVAKRGAAAAVVSERVAARLPLLRVANTTHALAQLAGWWRARFDALAVIGVTGSNGKTTIKEMINTILSQQRVGLVTHGNLNNHIGVPLTLLRLRDVHRFAVVEMGMNHAGEIAALSAIAKPTVAVISNAAPAHLAGLGTTADVARAKGEILDGMPTGSTAVLNADDAFYPMWRARAAHLRVRSFALEAKADVRGHWCMSNDCTQLRLEMRSDDDWAEDVQAEGHAPRTVTVHRPLPGRHNAYNTAAAVAASLAAGATVESVVNGLQTMRTVPGRLSVLRSDGGALILDDTYNANPASVVAALEVLSTYRGTRIAVLGDMAELGAEAERWHGDIGRSARRLGVDALYLTGELSVATAHAFGTGAHHFANHDTLLRALQPLASAHTVLLVKGSRSSHMEAIVHGLVGLSTMATTPTTARHRAQKD